MNSAKAIALDLEFYLNRCKAFGETPVLDIYGDVDPYSSHAKELEIRVRAQKINRPK